MQYFQMLNVVINTEIRPIKFAYVFRSENSLVRFYLTQNHSLHE